MGVNVNDELEDEGDVEDAVEEEGGQFTGHSGQVLTVGCWLTVKEVGLVVGTVARNVPLPAGTLFAPLLIEMLTSRLFYSLFLIQFPWSLSAVSTQC
jgi:uncharacterized membrane protein AbrB (regulator of aidB expression)